MERYLIAAINFSNTHADFAGPALFILSFASAIFIVGAFVPVTAATFGAGATVALGRWEPSIALWAMAGLIAGSLVSYEIGRRLPATSRATLVQKAPRYFNAAERLFGRFGLASLIVSRFVGPPATLPLITGYFGLSRSKFWWGNLISAVWAPVIMSIGYAVAQSVFRFG